jgi:hypothetical protein
VTDSLANTAVAIVVGPPLVGATAGALLFRKHRVLGGLGGFVAGIAATQLYVYMVNRQSQSALQASQAAVSTSWRTGKPYVWRGRVDASITTPDALAAALQAAGWTSVVVEWFGPTKFTSTTSPPPYAMSGDPGLYVAKGVWNGADNTAIPPTVASSNL